jgi:hypothetical protein
MIDFRIVRKTDKNDQIGQLRGLRPHNRKACKEVQQSKQKQFLHNYQFSIIH